MTTPRGGPRPTRRRFLEAAGAGVAAGWVGCARPGPAPAPLGLEGAPGVDLLPSGTALTDYSRDLVNYLVRVTAEARERRQRIIRGISTREQAVARQQAVVKELWTMLGGPLERGPLNPRVTGIVQRPGYRIEKVAFESRPRLYVTANLYVPDRPGPSSGDSRTARSLIDRQGLAHIPEAVLESRAQGLRRARVRPVRAGRTHRVSGRPAGPHRPSAAGRPSTSTPGAG